MNAYANSFRSAFPAPEQVNERGNCVRVAQDGLTKREYFAALAMQGIIASYVDTSPPYNFAAAEAVNFADALLAELAKEPKP